MPTIFDEIKQCVTTVDWNTKKVFEFNREGCWNEIIELV
jgi:hypothetical protein